MDVTSDFSIERIGGKIKIIKSINEFFWLDF